jgi:hypothetical protein
MALDPRKDLRSKLVIGNNNNNFTKIKIKVGSKMVLSSETHGVINAQ